jgi:hypothetical protein
MAIVIEQLIALTADWMMNAEIMKVALDDK